MKNLLIATSLLIGFALPAFADETTVVKEHDRPAGVTVGVPGVAGVRVGDPDGGCRSKTVHKEDGMGDSKTVHKSNCD